MGGRARLVTIGGALDAGFDCRDEVLEASLAGKFLMPTVGFIVTDAFWVEIEALSIFETILKCYQKYSK